MGKEPSSNSLSPCPRLACPVDVVESPMNISVHREKYETPEKESVTKSPLKAKVFAWPEEKEKQSPSSASLDTSFSSCFDRLSSPSGWTGTHKITAFKLQINKAHVRNKKKLEKKKLQKRKAAKKTVNILKRHR